MSIGHARRARRTTKAVLAPTWIEFEDATQAAQSRRTVTKKGNKTAGVAYPTPATATRTRPPWPRGPAATGR